MEEPNWSAFVKAATGVSGPPRPSLAWARARRTEMRVFDDRTEIGDWVLPHAGVTNATLYQTQSGIKNRVLELATPDRTVQINFNPGTSPEGHLPYPLTIAPFPAWMAKLRIVIWITVVVAIAILIFA